MALQVAISRDMFNWISGLFSFVALAATAKTIKDKKFTPIFAVPLVVLGFYGAFTWDMVRVWKNGFYLTDIFLTFHFAKQAYNTKSNRIKQYYEEIKNDPNYWFNPIDAPFQEKKE